MGSGSLSELIGDQLPGGSIVHIWDRTNDVYTTVSKTRFGWGSGSLDWGSSFWIVNSGATTNTVTLPGEVPADYNAGDAISIPIEGVDAVAYAYPVDVMWTNTTLAKNSQGGDVLHIWDVDQQAYVTYSKTRFGWGSATDLKLEVGQSFWYVPASGTADWTEQVPYSLNQ
jgi:hypothetical protein